MARQPNKKTMEKWDELKDKPRPRKPKVTNLDPLEVERVAILNCTQVELATFFNCSVELLLTEPYRSILTKGREQIKQRLKQKAIQLALNEDNVPMLKYSLANYCGWSNNNNAEITIIEKPAPTLVELYGQLTQEPNKD